MMSTCRPRWEYTSKLARRSEEIGFDLSLIAELNMNDIKGIDAPSLDAWSTSAALAAVTKTLELMVAVRPTFHLPALFAKQAANIDHISNGRLALNVVSSWWEQEAKMYGVDFERHDDRYGRTSEWLDVVNGAWSQKSFNHAGKYYQTENTVLEPKPVRSPRPPIYAGGESEAAKNLIAQKCDAYVMHGDSPEHVAAKIADMSARREKFGLGTHAIRRCGLRVHAQIRRRGGQGNRAHHRREAERQGLRELPAMAAGHAARTKNVDSGIFRVEPRAALRPGRVPPRKCRTRSASSKRWASICCCCSSARNWKKWKYSATASSQGSTESSAGSGRWRRKYSERPLAVRCGAFGDMVLLTALIRVLHAEFRAPGRYRDLGTLERTAAARAAGGGRDLQRAQPQDTLLDEHRSAADRAAIAGARRGADLVLRRRCGGQAAFWSAPAFPSRCIVDVKDHALLPGEHATQQWRRLAQIMPARRDALRAPNIDAVLPGCYLEVTQAQRAQLAAWLRTRRSGRSTLDSRADRQQAHDAARPAPPGRQQQILAR